MWYEKDSSHCMWYEKDSSHYVWYKKNSSHCVWYEKDSSHCVWYALNLSIQQRLRLIHWQVTVWAAQRVLSTLWFATYCTICKRYVSVSYAVLLCVHCTVYSDTLGPCVFSLLQ